MVAILKNKCTMCKGNKFLSFGYHCYYFTLSETYFIQLKNLHIEHPLYIIHAQNMSSTTSIKT